MGAQSRCERRFFDGGLGENGICIDALVMLGCNPLNEFDLGSAQSGGSCGLVSCDQDMISAQEVNQHMFHQMGHDGIKGMRVGRIKIKGFAADWVIEFQ